MCKFSLVKNTLKKIMNKDVQTTPTSVVTTLKTCTHSCKPVFFASPSVVKVRHYDSPCSLGKKQVLPEDSLLVFASGLNKNMVKGSGARKDKPMFYPQ
jgi:hypothetical protein